MSRSDAALACLGAGAVTGPAGAWVLWGPGAALLVLAVLFVLVAVLLGWDS